VREDAPLARANYSGDVRKLKLTDRERSWFDERRVSRIDRDLEVSVARELAEDLAKRVYRDLERATP
jgi:hypothetical protein